MTEEDQKRLEKAELVLNTLHHCVNPKAGCGDCQGRDTCEDSDDFTPALDLALGDMIRLVRKLDKQCLSLQPWRSHEEI